jgi:hypothetical protein
VLVCKIYKELKNKRARKQIIGVKKWTNESNRHFLKEAYKWPI